MAYFYSASLFAWRWVLKTRGKPAQQRPQWSEPVEPPLHPPSKGLVPSRLPARATDANQDVDSLSTVEKGRKSNKRKHTFMKNFGTHIKIAIRLHLSYFPAPSRNGRSVSQCGTCLAFKPKIITFIPNGVSQKWNKHAMSCPGLKKLVPPILSAEAQNMVMHVTPGGDKHDLLNLQTQVHIHNRR